MKIDLDFPQPLKYALSRQSIANYAYIHKDCGVIKSVFFADCLVDAKT